MSTYCTISRKNVIIATGLGTNMQSHMHVITLRLILHNQCVRPSLRCEALIDTLEGVCVSRCVLTHTWRSGMNYHRHRSHQWEGSGRPQFLESKRRDHAAVENLFTVAVHKERSEVLSHAATFFSLFPSLLPQSS